MMRLARSNSNGLAANWSSCCENTVAMLLPLAEDCCCSGGPRCRAERTGRRPRESCPCPLPAALAAAAAPGPKGDDSDRGRPPEEAAAMPVAASEEGREVRSGSPPAPRLIERPLLATRTV